MPTNKVKPNVTITASKHDGPCQTIMGHGEQSWTMVTILTILIEPQRADRDSLERTLHLHTDRRAITGYYVPYPTSELTKVNKLIVLTQSY